MLSPLANPIFARLFAAQVIALLGTGLTTVALALLAYEIAGSDAGRVLGTALAIKMIAYVTLSPIAGSFAQRLPRRGYLIALDIARAVFVGCMVFVTAIWQIYLLVFLMQACSAGFTPVFQATIPDVLEDEDTYTKALSLSRLAYDLENLLSPTFAAAALVVISFNQLFAVNAVAFLISAALVFAATLPAAVPDGQTDGWPKRALNGLRNYLATPRLRGLLALSLTVAATGAMVLVNTVVYVRDYLGPGQQETVWMMAAYGAGSMLAALTLPRLLKSGSDRTIMLTGGVLSLAAMLAGLVMPAFAWTAVIWFAVGLANASTYLPAGHLLRLSSTKATRAAYFTAHFALSHACWLITYPLAGWLGSAFGLQAAFAGLALVGGVGLGLTLILWPPDHSGGSRKTA